MAKKTGNDNRQLQSAKRAKNDEFYTQISDIEHELRHYRKQFHNKTILCNCDDPRVSNFFRHFLCSFCRLRIKKLIAVCYKNLNRLSEKAISQLKQEHRKAKTKWEADRLKTIYLLGEGWQPEVVGNILDRDKRTILAYYQNYKRCEMVH